MKKFFKYSVLLISALVLSSASLSAQGELVLSKKVKDNLNGQYTLTLETYVTGSSITTVTPCDVVLVLDRSTSMWSNMKSGDKTRREALMTGVDAFVDVLKSGKDASGNPVHHNIAVVDYWGGGQNADYFTNTAGFYKYLSGTDSNPWMDITKVGTTISTNVSDHYPSTKPSGTNINGTPAATGLHKAYEFFAMSGIAGNGHPKFVIFFTDGQCGYGSGTTWENVQRKAAQWAINEAYAIKNTYDAQIFAVGAFGSMTAAGQLDVNRYMNLVSSRFGKQQMNQGGHDDAATNWSTLKEVVSGDNGEPDNEFVFLAENASDLKKAFENIAEKVNPSAFPLDGTSSVVVDVLADKFVLPQNTDVSKIRLYYAPIDTDNAVTAPVKWKDEASTSSSIKIYKDANNVVIAQGSATPADPAKVDHVEYWEPIASTSDVISFSKDEDGADVVNVTGFDFSANYVGINTSGSGTKSWNPDGKKLIIQFEIDVDPSHPGGVGADGDGVFTNKNTSGVYRIQRNEDGDPILDPATGKPLLEEDPVQPYEQPKVFLPYLKIVKTGLKQGESATFKVTKVTSAAGTDVVTSDPFTATVIVTQTTDPAEDPNAYAVVKLVHQGYYKVEETSWAWAYTPATPYQVKQILTVPVDDSTKPEKFVTYTFSNTGITDAAEHAENFVINNMSKDRSLGDSKTKNATLTF